MTQAIQYEIRDAIYYSDVQQVRRLLEAYSNAISEYGNVFLTMAAQVGNLPVVQMLVELGVDKNSCFCGRGALSKAAYEGHLTTVAWLLNEGVDVNSHPDYETPLGAAADGGRIQVMKLLLERGADMNLGRCPPIAAAAGRGQLDAVRMLLAAGADPHILFGGFPELALPKSNALSQAIWGGHEEVAELLRAHGAVVPPPPDFELARRALLTKFEEKLGPLRQLAVQNIVTGDLAVGVHLIDLDWCHALITVGMSNRTLPAPDGYEGEFGLAELVVPLPKDWPLTPEALADPNHLWPIEWMFKIAHFDFTEESLFGWPYSILATDEPPQPLGLATQQTCWLAIIYPDAPGLVELEDGRRIWFRTLTPLYTEERDLEREKGIDHLLNLFKEHGVGRKIDPHRVNVAALP